MTWWGFYGRGVSFEGFSGAHGAGERAQSAEYPTGNLGGAVFDKTTVSTTFYVLGCNAFFCFVGKATHA